jgi:hypothetical protein
MALSDDQLKLIAETYTSTGGNAAEAARVLGMPVETVKYQVRAAVRRNMFADAFGGETPPGYLLGKVTQLHASDDGKRMEWRHLIPEPEAVKDFLERATETFSQSLVAIPTVPLSRMLYNSASLLTVYPLPDVHLGQYSWGKETSNVYDLDIARDTVLQTFQTAATKSEPTENAIVLGLGDYFHADGNDARTPKSGNQLDVDGRFAKVQMLGAEVLVSVVDIALQKHEYVTVKVLPGNHDPRGGDVMTLALLMRYANNPRVTIDRSPATHWFYQWGRTMIAAHHGHETKPEQMPGVMASYEPAMWGSTDYRYAYLGHIHKRSRGLAVDERSGAIYETFQAITAKDAWNRGQGHASGRSIATITLSKTEGETARFYTPISPK